MLDAGFGVLRAIRPAQAPDDILVVGLDDAGAVSPEVDAAGPSLRKLPDVLSRIARGAPRAIALHAALPRGSLDAAAPGLDDALATALSVAQAAAPLVIGITTDARGEAIPIHERLLRGVDRARLRLLAAAARRGRHRAAGGARPSDPAGAVAHRPRDGCARFSRGAANRGSSTMRSVPLIATFPRGGSWRSATTAALAKLFRDRVVFVAPVAGPGDRVPQPVSLAGWEPPSAEPAAVLAHAQTLRTVLHGSPIREAPLPLMLLVVAAAALVARVSAPVAPAVGALAAAGACAVALFALRSGWYGPPAAALATLLAAVVASRLLHRFGRPAQRALLETVLSDIRQCGSAVGRGAVRRAPRKVGSDVRVPSSSGHLQGDVRPRSRRPLSALPGNAAEGCVFS